MKQILAFLCFLHAATLTLAEKGGYFVLTRNDAGQTASLRRSRRQADNNIDIETFNVLSFVTSRYSRVEVTSLVRNNDDVARDVSIEMRLPKNAFISNFSMVIDSVTYVGIVKAKEEARQQYNAAVARGESAGLVSAKSNDIQTFDVSVNVAAGNSVTFHLSYQELLIRKLGFYNQVIYVNPGQVVEGLRVEVHISEPSGIRTLEVSPPTAGSERRNFRVVEREDNVSIRRTASQAFITYLPSSQHQRSLLQNEDLSFSVTYDVTRVELGGELVIRNGYFVHFFAPATTIPVIPKNIVFIIDRSGSMRGTKIQQTKEAFTTILDDLKRRDRFNIITFASEARVWRPNQMVEVTKRSLSDAKRFVRSIIASGATNFNDATLKGIALLETITRNTSNNLEEASMMIMLSDGDPTSGVINTKVIRRNVKNRINGRYSLFCLGFGQNLDYSFLQKLSLENGGLSRQIFTTSDAALQLKGFYDEVASPLLAHVIIRYSGAKTSNTTRRSFNNFFDGSEILVAGQFLKEDITDNRKVSELESVLEGRAARGPVRLKARGKPIDESFVDDFFDMEKLWAYLTIKDLLENKTRIEDTDRAAMKAIDSRVLYLSLRYNFVTPLTSMVVTKPMTEPEPSPHTSFSEVLQALQSLLGSNAAGSLSARRLLSSLNPSLLPVSGLSTRAPSSGRIIGRGPIFSARNQLSSRTSTSTRNNARTAQRNCPNCAFARPPSGPRSFLLQSYGTIPISTTARPRTTRRYRTTSRPRTTSTARPTTTRFATSTSPATRASSTASTSTAARASSTASTSTATKASSTASTSTATRASSTASNSTTARASSTASTSTAARASSTASTSSPLTLSTLSTFPSTTKTAPSIQSTVSPTTLMNALVPSSSKATTSSMSSSTSGSTITLTQSPTSNLDQTSTNGTFSGDQSCGENLILSSSQNISSPGYPGLYPSNSRCVWRVTLDEQMIQNHTMRLQLFSLDMEDDECLRDRIVVYSDLEDHENLDSPSSLFCGFLENKTHLDARYSFKVVFESDEIVQGRGFLMNLQIR